MKQEQLPYSNFKMQNFRGIIELQTPQLARVNLITGTNNSGKSSLLEAIRLHQQNATLHIIRDILSEREEYMGEPDLTEDSALSIWEQHPITSLFRKAENNKDEYQPLKLSTKGDNQSKDITMKLEWTEYQDLHPAVRAMEEPPLLIPGQHYTEPALVIYSEQGKKPTRWHTCSDPESQPPTATHNHWTKNHPAPTSAPTREWKQRSSPHSGTTSCSRTPKTTSSKHSGP